jgi:hypothetical protein
MNVDNCSFSSSLPTKTPGSVHLEKIWRAWLYTLLAALEGVYGLRGVSGLLAIRWRCLGVSVIFEASASRCRGVCGVARRLDFAGTDDLLVLETEKWALILFGDDTTRFEGVGVGLSCAAGDDTGSKNGLSFSSFPRTSVSRRFALVCMPLSDAVHSINV